MGTISIKSLTGYMAHVLAESQRVDGNSIDNAWRWSRKGGSLTLMSGNGFVKITASSGWGNISFEYFYYGQASYHEKFFKYPKCGIMGTMDRAIIQARRL